MELELEPDEIAADLRARARSIVGQMRAAVRVIRRERRVMTQAERRKFYSLSAELDQVHAAARDLAPLLHNRAQRG